MSPNTQGVFVERPLAIESNGPLYARDYQQVIELYSRHLNTLTQVARRNRRISRIFSVGLVPLSLYLLMQDDPSAELTMMAFAMLAAALNNARRELHQLYSNITLDRNLATFKDQLASIVKDYDVGIQCRPGGSLATSSLRLTSTRSHGVSRSEVIARLQESLLANGFELLYCDRNTLAIYCDSLPSGRQRRRAREMFVAGVDRTAEIKILRKQLKKLFKHFSNDNVIFSITRDEQNLPALTATLRVDASLAERFDRLLAGDVSLTWDDSDENQTAFLTLTGTQRIRDQSLDDFYKQQQRSRARRGSSDEDGASTNQAFSSAVPGDIYSTARSSGRKRKKKQPPNESSVNVNPPMPMARPDIVWPSGHRFVFGAENNRVTRIHCASMPPFRLFAILVLEREDFPTELAYLAFCRIIQDNPRIVPKKGSQGLVSVDASEGMVRGHDGTWFFSSFKAKPLGHCGDIRVYAESEQAPTGQVLHRFKVIKVHAH